MFLELDGINKISIFGVAHGGDNMAVSAIVDSAIVAIFVPRRFDFVIVNEALLLFRPTVSSTAKTSYQDQHQNDGVFIMLHDDSQNIPLGEND
jgi:hypothetical protein